MLRPLIRGGGDQGGAQTVGTAVLAAMEIWSEYLDEALHLKSSKMLACTAVTMTKLPGIH